MPGPFEKMPMQETFPCSCYSALLARAQVLLSPRACPFIFSTEISHVQSSLQIPVKAFLTDVWNRAKGFTFVKLFIVFSIVIWARHIGTMIDSVGAVQGFPSQYSSSAASGSRICSSDTLPK